MKQILQNMKTGVLSVAEVPPPVVQPGRVLVRTVASLISAGTEKSKIDLGKKSLLGKAKDRPDLVRQVIHKAKQEGLLNTFTAVKAKLDASVALGYSAAGVVVDVGAGVDGFRAGDRVACAGAGYASHAEMLCVPKNLCVRLPDAVTFDEGACGTLGAIALQGVRLAQPTLGEAVAVIGLGLLGQLTVQLLRANGCRVFGVDTDETKLRLAQELGAEQCATPGEARQLMQNWSRGRGADAVLITAATSSNEPLELAGEVSRVKGRVVVVGLVGMDVPRQMYYERELSLQLSMSYGPGRYDAEYEERGHDYPFAYVRWTEGRNIEAFLDLVATKSVRLTPLITHRFPIESGEDAYKLISGETKEPYLGILLQYDAAKELPPVVALKPAVKQAAVRLGVIGAGSYARKFLLPNFKANGVAFATIATASGLSARDLGASYGFAACVAGAEEVLRDDNVNLIVIATRHDSHAALAREALLRGKHVFVEKPLALNDEELDAVLEAARNSPGRLLVGFNRRFSPLAQAAREFFTPRQSPLSILYRVNAGRIPREHWIQDPAQGGRIVGEVCHFIDLIHFLTGSVTTRVYAEAVAARNHEIVSEDSIFATLRLADGSNAAIAYLAEGDKTVPKERVEIYGAGQTFVLDDFRRASLFKGGKETTKRLINQDKGQAEEIRALCAMVRDGGPSPISLEDLAATTRATFRLRESLQTGAALDV
jgi:predicted dehydrogenase/threonine dehydrogenase-like Zn-dependent dehydrogenase